MKTSKLSWRRRLLILFCALLLFCSLFALASPTPAYAEEVTISTIVGGYSYFQTFNSAGAWVDLGTPMHYINQTGNVAYCIQTTMGEPQNAAYTSTDGGNLIGYYQVLNGIKIILENGYPTTTAGFSADEARYATANAMRFFLADWGSPYVPAWMNISQYGQFFRAKSGYENLLYWCVYLRNLALNQITEVYPPTGSISFSSSALTLSENGEWYTGNVTVTTSNCAGGYTLSPDGIPSGTEIYGYTGNSGDVLTINVPKSYAGQSFTLTANGSGYSKLGDVVYYAPYNSSLQQLVTYVSVTPGDYDVIATSSMTVSAPASTEATIRITKTDSETGAPLPGVWFKLYDYRGSFHSSNWTDSNGQISFKVDPGSYSYKETQTIEGYQLDSTEYPVTVSAGQIVDVAVTNDPIRLSSIEIKKLDSATNQPLLGVKIGLYDSAGTLLKSSTTDSSGIALFTGVSTGSYKYGEIEAPPGYILNTSKYDISVPEGNRNYTATLYNDPILLSSIEIKKLDSTTNHPLQGAKIGLYDSAGTLLKSSTTDSNGIALFTGVNTGSYKYGEIEAPAGYILNTYKYDISVPEGNRNYTATIYNTPLTGIINIIKVDAAGNPLSGAVFELQQLNNSGEFESIVTAETGSSGRVSFTGLGLYGQVYRVIESKAPIGHSLQAWSVFEGVLDEWYSEVNLTVCDGAKFTMPFTGVKSFNPITDLARALHGYFLCS